MTTLDDAWKWYQAAKSSLVRMERLAGKYWEELPWTGRLGRDSDLRIAEADDVAAHAELARQPLDDLAIVVMFSVFESVVRDFLADRLNQEIGGLREPILREAADDALRGVTEGSFYRRVLAPLKEQGAIDADLVTQVDQVRDYRNWVAHGRRGSATNFVSPYSAYLRLTRFLTVLIPPIPAEGE